LAVANMLLTISDVQERVVKSGKKIVQSLDKNPPEFVVSASIYMSILSFLGIKKCKF